MRTSALMGVVPPTRSNTFSSIARKQLRLLGQGNVVDVVEIEGAAFGQIEAAFAALVGAGEGALLVAVEFALDELRREERATDLDVGEALAVGEAMDDAGDEVLAHAGLAAEEDVGVGAGTDLDHVPDAAHDGAGPTIN